MNQEIFAITYHSISQLPEKWDEISSTNKLLSTNYLTVLEQSAPVNMCCIYIGFFKSTELVGVALAQYIDLKKVTVLNTNNQKKLRGIRNWFFEKQLSQILIIGNNMFTGEHCYQHLPEINEYAFLKSLSLATKQVENELESTGKKVHLTVIKDFENSKKELFKNQHYKHYYPFEIQPNMVFDIPENWNNFDDYLLSITKKYRDQYKRARRKSEGITKRKLNESFIAENQELIYKLHFNVVKNAPFNTFHLNKNHFEIFKHQFDGDFLFYGYFLNEKLIGFNTLIKNNDHIETYFLGYDNEIQKENLLYLNMLYDMLGYAINKGYQKVVFARTALEIKSSVGAKPKPMFGLMKHQHWFLNYFVKYGFQYFEPHVAWQERNPFKSED